MSNRAAPDSPQIMIYKVSLLPAIYVVGVTEDTNEGDNQVKCCVIYYNALYL